MVYRAAQSVRARETGMRGFRGLRSSRCVQGFSGFLLVWELPRIDIEPGGAPGSQSMPETSSVSSSADGAGEWVAE